MKSIPTSISKKILWRYVNKKLNYSIHHYHVFSVISILFEELVKDWSAGKEIMINNFGTFVLQQMPNRHYHDFRDGTIKLGTGHKLLHMFLSDKLKKKLTKHLDIEDTWKGQNESKEA
jgi:nucleoid DNA-binding protein